MTGAGSMPVNRLLERLNGVTETGPGRWLACCPAHDDRRPSLTVRETGDGTALLKCWGGCGAADVVQAAGLELRDLFPPRHDGRSALRPGQRWIPRDVLQAISSEVIIVLVAAAAVRSGIAVKDADMSRLALAAGRLRAAAREVGCRV